MDARQAWGLTVDEFRAVLMTVTEDELAEFVVDVYEKLFIDEETGEYSEVGSQAAMSAADFVESCNLGFQRLLVRKDSDG